MNWASPERWCRTRWRCVAPAGPSGFRRRPFARSSPVTTCCALAASTPGAPARTSSLRPRWRRSWRPPPGAAHARAAQSGGRAVEDAGSVWWRSGTGRDRRGRVGHPGRPPGAASRGHPAGRPRRQRHHPAGAARHRRRRRGAVGPGAAYRRRPDGWLEHSAAGFGEMAVAIAKRAIGRTVVVISRDTHRHAWARDFVDALIGNHPRVVLVETGWPAAWRPAGLAAYVATYGASRANAGAVTEILMDAGLTR